ncbi:MAG TPA: imidazolonepropionase [Albidovulum sp.]|uniref:imidazolonepropionase n=1 Tax=Albidovulum sp. TaxID=1872424 RepID=UPI002BF7E425|nr:imidazolonepropionase [Albidovulum sp.]
MTVSEKLPQLWTNARLFTGAEGGITEGDILIRDGQIAAVGTGLDAPQGATRIDCGGRLVTPALIDCHTHLVYGGNRAREFQMRLEGASYAEIAAAGGGIVSTMRATREASVDQLVASALPRLDSLLREGVGTVEIKSGYGLSVESEIRMLRAARKLATLRPVRIRTTWLAAHALPPEYKDNRAGYIDRVALAGMEEAHAEGLVDAVDGFCEHLAFTPAEIGRVFDKAHDLGLPVKLHAEQLSWQGGAALTARHGGLSADHLEYMTEEDARAMAAAGTVAVLLPGAFYMLRETKVPPVAALRAAGCDIAVSTDANPGTSPMTSLLLAMNMAAVLFGLTVDECLKGTTANAAKALGLQAETGRIMPGLAADLAIWNAEGPAELVNPMGFNPLHARYFKGQKV